MQHTKAERLMNVQHTKVEGFVNIASQLLNQSTSKGLVIDSNLTIELISKLFIQQMECRCVCVSLLNDFSHERMSIFAYMSFKMWMSLLAQIFVGVFVWVSWTTSVMSERRRSLMSSTFAWVIQNSNESFRANFCRCVCVSLLNDFSHVRMSTFA